MEGWREKKVRGLEREGKIDNGSTRIKQTELVPREKSDRSKNLTGTIDFFSFFARVFSASRCLLSKRGNLRGHLRRWAAYTFHP